MPVSKPGVEQVIDLINTANELALNTNLVSLGVPTPTASGAARNTTVTVYPSATLPGLKEPVAVYYDRVDMSEMYGQAVVELEYDPAWVAHQDIMLALNDKFGVFLNNEDVVNTILDFEGVEGWPRTVILTAASNSYYCRGTLEISLLEPSAQPNLVAHPAVTLRGLNGILYVSAESGLQAMDSGTFESVLGGQPGYYQGHARHARIVDNNLYIDFNYLGFASQYTGQLTGIELYGCNPETGAVVETIPLADVTDWNYSQSVYPITLPALNMGLAWRGKLEYNLINEVDSGENMAEAIDLAVFMAFPAEIFSINGVTVNIPLAVSSDYSQLTNGDYIVSVLYDDGGNNSVGYDNNPNTAVVSIGGVEHTLEFDMIGT